jgi:hypothetical protein
VDLRVIFRQVGAQSSIDEARSVELARRIVHLYDVSFRKVVNLKANARAV